MRVLFITQWFDPEPGFSRGLPLARALINQGFEIKVLTGFPNYPGGRIYAGYQIRMHQHERIDGVEVHRVPLYPSHDSSGIHRILNYSSFALSASALGSSLARWADVAYVYQGGAAVGLPSMLFKGLWGVPFVYHIADMWPESVIHSGMAGGIKMQQTLAVVLSRWCKTIYRKAARITVLSPGFKRLLIERGVEPQKVEIIYNWTDEDVFKPLPKNDTLAAQLGLDRSFNVLYAGNIGAFQGIDTLLNAARLVKHIPEIKFVIAGTGQKDREIRQMAKELNLPNVVFLGHRDYHEMPPLYPLADVLLIHLNDHPFFQTTIPGKTQVSLACGRPILMAVRGDAADIIRAAEAGIVCEPQNPAAMAQSIIGLFRLPKERREELGRNGRNYYLREMCLSRATQQMMTVLQVAPA